MIWFNKDIDFNSVAHFGKNTMGDHIGMEWLELGPDYLKARIPVDHRTIQPEGILHGGASCVLAETLGSFASHLIIDNTRQICVGLEINANHIRAVKQGSVTGTARPIHIGRSTHVWDIRIVDDNDRLVCISRLTVAILQKGV